MGYLVLARKWRPRGFDDLVGQEPIMRILKNAIEQGRIAHAYLFSGPRGVGKTSSARILAKALNCKSGPTPTPCGECASCAAVADGSSIDVIEIDGASNNSVDDIRDLREKVKYAPSAGRYKIYIIDEVHMLSGSAFNALLKTLEEPPPHVIFVLATTEMKKIPATVLSRCQHMPFRRISTATIRARLELISASEGIQIATPALGLIARAADGSMRDSLTILDQIASFSTDIREEDVKNLLGIADFGLLAQTTRALLSGDRVLLLETIHVLTEQGADLRSFTKELIQFVRDLLVGSIVRKPEEVLDFSHDELSVVRELVARSSEDQLTLMLSELMKAAYEVRSLASPRLALELALIRASFLSTMKPIREVLEHLGEYEPQRPKIQAAPEKKASVLPAAILPREKSCDVPPEEPSAGTPAAPEDITSLWARVASRIDPPLSAILQQASVELEGEELRMTLDQGHAVVFQDSVKNSVGLIEKILKEESGKSLRITLATSKKKPVRRKELREKVLEEPLVREALELFEGRIVDVSGTANTNNGGDHV